MKYTGKLLEKVTSAVGSKILPPPPPDYYHHRGLPYTYR